jgi:tRNA(Ile)-lysidine synthase TilS/MesJ
LSVYKDDIIKYAHLKEIPYLPNSTPTWSQRGQIRNKIIPCLDEWDKGFVPALFDLSNHIEELYSILEDKVQSFINRGEKIMNKDEEVFVIKVSSLEEIPREIIFWRLFIQRVFGIYDISIKALNNIKNTLQKITLNCNTNRKIIVSKALFYDISVQKTCFQLTIIKKSF